MDASFLERDTVTVAKELLGCELVRQTEAGLIRVAITETEAYKGSDDPASHASRAVTPRNRLMFGEVGRLYVYLIYGMHLCINVVAHEPGGVGAVLLRAARPLEGLELIRGNRGGATDRNLLNGPGKLAQGLGITREQNGCDLLAEPPQRLALEPGAPPAGPILVTPRIGITKAVDYPWRFVAE
ncbi:DNA-3-methyladenine glycosylase [Paenibacillus chitinolyticus]|uniref:DNA-3-methyladenine glycosylase n=1 Tax=Paenibacillus chitinolyticus TaxID=79263 RepID=UPI002DB64839|nr:DNA-3-methyladenine glycosylase [Paenibacillus chitinolyticus]MEC0246033.1 DNA-3-methyladenine glycosylase [Paenibacillus chitinolyticus]